MKEALLQQKEIQEEAEAQENANNSFYAVEDTKVKEDEEVDNIDDIDEFNGFSENRSQFGGYEVSEFRLKVFFFLIKQNFCHSLVTWFLLYSN